MSGNTWPSNMTRHKRYCDGLAILNDPVISKYVLLYSLIKDKKSLRVLDVGCSTGSPARHMRGYLSTLGVDCVIDGLDSSEEVMAEATSNLHKFYRDDLFSASLEPVYDIVICSRLLRFLDPPMQCEGVSRCASFCNKGGVVITDVMHKIHYRIGGHAMLPKAEIPSEAARHMEDWNGKTCFRKCWIQFRTCLRVMRACLLSRLERSCITRDGKMQSSCAFCQNS